MSSQNPSDSWSPTKRFSNRVDDYVKYRPSYPAGLLDTLERFDALTPTSVVTDIGSGTGLLTQLFLERGNVVVGVEPNREMRQAGELFLSKYPKFSSVDGSAEHTTLPSASFDLVVAGQAFHWFDWPTAKVEFSRILRPQGWVALIWNERAEESSAFQAGYEAMAKTFASDYSHVDHRKITPAVIGEFFSPNTYALHTFDSGQTFDLESLRGRWLSSSYAPKPGDRHYAEAMAALEALFAAHALNGHVRFVYETKMYIGQLL